MQEKNNKLVEEAFLQMKQVEEAIAENAKGILQSTMKEEISQLVKESLSEQNDQDFETEDDEEMDVDQDFETEDDEEMGVDQDFEDDEEMDDDQDFEDDEEMGFEMDMDSDESPIDLSDASDEEILKVFKSMGEEDGIIVKKDGEDIHLTDEDDEYLIKLGESEEDRYEDLDKSDIDSIIDKIFTEDSNINPYNLEEEDQPMYEIEMDNDDENIYEIEIDEEEEFEEEYEEESEEEYDNTYIGESKIPKKREYKEGKSTPKPKGIVGKGPKKVDFKTNTKGGFNEKRPEAFKGDIKAMGIGRVKDVFKKGENMEGKHKLVKKTETKESSRTLGMGNKFRKGGLPKPRTASKFNANANIKESLEKEVTMLRQKNEEYRKALNIFREKLTEVAIFNSNLAYATRLFTEHSTTKKEKINILRRFDGVSSLKESKLLYKSIKEQFSNPESKPINETIERKLNKTVSSGSSVSLIESKTYENPQFLRMKDLMGKLG
jgi:hypothetical protein